MSDVAFVVAISLDDNSHAEIQALLLKLLFLRHLEVQLNSVFLLLRLPLYSFVHKWRTRVWNAGVFDFASLGRLLLN